MYPPANPDAGDAKDKGAKAKAIDKMANGNMFPDLGLDTSSLRTTYTYKLAEGTPSTKQLSPAVIAQRLRLHSNQTEYCSWNYQILAYCQSCAVMRFTESSVRAAIFASLEGTLNHELTPYFGETLGVATIAETLRQLDIRFQNLTQHDESFMTNFPTSSL